MTTSSINEIRSRNRVLWLSTLAFTVLFAVWLGCAIPTAWLAYAQNYTELLMCAALFGHLNFRGGTADAKPRLPRRLPSPVVADMEPVGIEAADDDAATVRRMARHRFGSDQIDTTAATKPASRSCRIQATMQSPVDCQRPASNMEQINGVS